MLFGKETLEAWPVKDIGQDIVAKKIPVRNTIGYEVHLIHRFDIEGNVIDTYFDANVPLEILFLDGFEPLRNKLAEAVNPRRLNSIEADRGEVTEAGQPKEHVIFRLNPPACVSFSHPR